MMMGSLIERAGMEIKTLPNFKPCIMLIASHSKMSHGRFWLILLLMMKKRRRTARNITILNGTNMIGVQDLKLMLCQATISYSLRTHRKTRTFQQDKALVRIYRCFQIYIARKARKAISLSLNKSSQILRRFPKSMYYLSLDLLLPSQMSKTSSIMPATHLFKGAREGRESILMETRLMMMQITISSTPIK